MANGSATLTGTLEAIRFHKTGFLIGKLDSGVSIKGPMVAPQVGMEYAFRGRMERHPRFGETFVFSDYTASYPKDATAIRAYLIENCKWIGPEISKRLVNAYGQETLAVCKADPERVARETRAVLERRLGERARARGRDVRAVRVLRRLHERQVRRHGHGGVR